jgi:hypothetical protein
MVAFGSVAKEA